MIRIKLNFHKKQQHNWFFQSRCCFIDTLWQLPHVWLSFSYCLMECRLKAVPTVRHPERSEEWRDLGDLGQYNKHFAGAAFGRPPTDQCKVYKMEKIFDRGGSFMSCNEFCTCTDYDCPFHPRKHNGECAPCIRKNLENCEIPACFFKKAGEGHLGRGEHSFYSFAERVFLRE